MSRRGSRSRGPSHCVINVNDQAPHVVSSQKSNGCCICCAVSLPILVILGSVTAFLLLKGYLPRIYQPDLPGTKTQTEQQSSGSKSDDKSIGNSVNTQGNTQAEQTTNSAKSDGSDTKTGRKTRPDKYTSNPASPSTDAVSTPRTTPGADKPSPNQGDTHGKRYSGRPCGNPPFRQRTVTPSTSPDSPRLRPLVPIGERHPTRGTYSDRPPAGPNGNSWNVRKPVSSAQSPTFCQPAATGVTSLETPSMWKESIFSFLVGNYVGSMTNFGRIPLLGSFELSVPGTLAGFVLSSLIVWWYRRKAREGAEGYEGYMNLKMSLWPF